MQVVPCEMRSRDGPVGGGAPLSAVIETLVGIASRRAATHAEVAHRRRIACHAVFKPAVEPRQAKSEKVIGDLAVEGGSGAEVDVARVGNAALPVRPRPE